jgi:hypothetical protein
LPRDRPLHGLQRDRRRGERRRDRRVRDRAGGSYHTAQATTVPTPASTTPTTAPVVSVSATTPLRPRFEGWVDPASVGQPYYGATVAGLFTF